MIWLAVWTGILPYRCGIGRIFHMHKVATSFDGLYLIESKIFEDSRGVLNKYYQKSIFDNMGIDTDFREMLYTVSHKDVVRGMHFQKPPSAHAKLVCSIKGAILDVVLDLRKNATTYGKAYSVVLSEKNKKIIYIPTGFAHGYKVLEDNSITLYHTTSEFNPEDDAAIHWNSFGFDWGTEKPIVSEKDMKALPFESYASPF